MKQKNEQISKETMQITLETYANCDMNVTLTAKTLFVNHNTIEYRFERLKKLTGLNAKKFNDLVKLLGYKR